MTKFSHKSTTLLTIIFLFTLLISCKKDEDENSLPYMTGVWTVDSIKVTTYENGQATFTTTLTGSLQTYDFKIPNKAIVYNFFNVDTIPFQFISNTNVMTDLNMDAVLDTITVQFNNPAHFLWKQQFTGSTTWNEEKYFVRKVQ